MRGKSKSTPHSDTNVLFLLKVPDVLFIHLMGNIHSLYSVHFSQKVSTLVFIVSLQSVCCSPSFPLYGKPGACGKAYGPVFPELFLV
jgi:hypothetical protein